MDLIGREALVEELNKLYGEQTVSKYSYSRDCKNARLGIALAINKVKIAPTVEAYSAEVVKQIMWERDMAIQQLNDYGVQLGEKADCVRVVRCKDCKFKDSYRSGSVFCFNHGMSKQYDDFCSYGERRGD